MLRIVLAVLVMTILANCSSSETSTTDAAGSGDATQDLPVIGDARPIDASTSGCVPANCDDGVACTEDICMFNRCMHTLQPSRCPAGQTCDARGGCMPGHACGGNEDCIDMDPCTVNERCDPAVRVCLHDVLDGDHDGDPPRSCGGGDCDDSDPRVNSHLREICDGLDNNCNGMVDDNVTDCLAGATCQVARCVCTAAERTTCPQLGPSFCIDLNSDPSHCGSCTHNCGDGTCSSGTCSCNAGRSRCTNLVSGEGECIDLQTNTHHCGSCDVQCSSGRRCVNGTCTCPSSVDLNTDPRNCGRCDNVCPLYSTCVGGRCTCDTGFMMCGSQCVNTMLDSSNCGACGTTCTSPTPCTGGSCRCPAGMTLCTTGTAPGCLNLNSNPFNCGACGHVCSPMFGGSPRYCEGGQCICASSPTRIWCPSSIGDQCVDPLTSSSNCGTCGNVCRPGETCASGMCTCRGTVCGGVCVADLNTDATNCGRCGNTCPSGQSCQSGVCRAGPPPTGMCPSSCSSNLDCESCWLPGETRTGSYCCNARLCIFTSSSSCGSITPDAGSPMDAGMTLDIGPMSDMGGGAG